MNPLVVSAAQTCDTLKVAAVQLNSAADWPSNQKKLDHWLAEAARQGVELLLLPEFFTQIGASLTARLQTAEVEGEGPIQAYLADQARRLGIWLVAGSLALKSDQADKTTNTCLVYDPSGRQVARYDKIHLFGFQKNGERYDESETFVAGQQPVCFDLPWGRVGLGICYDLRFPELFRQLPSLDLLLLPAAFTVTTGQAHWSLLLRARAVENQCYVLAAAQVGEHADGRRTWGHSQVIDAWGEVQVCLDEGEGLVIQTLSQQHLQAVRDSLPAMQHRRLD